MCSSSESVDGGSPKPDMSNHISHSKRNATDAELDSADGRATRKRAAKACLSCRTRKVRCSVSDHGVPCYNCSLDDVECVVPERKKPTRPAKREKTLGTLLSEAIMHSGSHSPPVEGPTPRQSDPEGIQHGESDSLPRTASEMSHPKSEISQFGDGLNVTKLIRCDEELARWLGVIPPRVLDRLLDYLQSFNDNASPRPSAQKPHQKRQKFSDKARRLPSQGASAGGLDEIFTDTAQHKFAHRQTGMFGNRRMPSQLLSLNLPVKDTREQLTDAQCLNQLRQSYSSATTTLRALEMALRKAGNQLNDRHEKHLSCFNTPPCGPQTSYSGPTVALTPPPENSPMCKFSSVNGDRVISSRHYSNPQSFVADGDEHPTPHEWNAKLSTPEASQVGTSETSWMDEFEGAFHSLVDFGDTLFESS